MTPVAVPDTSPPEPSHSDLAEMYLATDYVVDDLPASFTIKLGEANDQLNDFLDRGVISSWAFLTAWNPRSTPLNADENYARQHELLKFLRSNSYHFLHGRGVGTDPAWEPEESLFIIDIERSAAIEIGRQFDQNAILWGVNGREPELIWCF